MNDTPITDRARLASDRSMVFACDMGKLERVANPLAESLETALALLDGFNMDKEHKALSEYEAMKKGTT